jgi:hypothetical protein
VIGWPSLTAYERLVVAGKVRPPADSSVDLRRIPRVRSTATAAEIIADVRGDPPEPASLDMPGKP